jgi:hypothetical protein
LNKNILLIAKSKHSPCLLELISQNQPAFSLTTNQHQQHLQKPSAEQGQYYSRVNIFFSFLASYHLGTAVTFFMHEKTSTQMVADIIKSESQ